MSDASADRHFFTVAEANALVSELEQRFGRIRANLAKGREITAHLASLGGAHPGAYRDQLRRVHAEVHLEVAAIQAHGALVKDVNGGLVDFWHRRDGAEVLLCWKVGEDEIRFFHDETGGFDGRRPLDGDATGDPDDGDGDPGAH